MGKRCIHCRAENEDSATVCVNCGDTITDSTGSGNAAFVWKIVCPVCKREYDVQDENSKIEICTQHKDEVDKRKIAKKRPQKVFLDTVCSDSAPIEQATVTSEAEPQQQPQRVLVMTDVDTGKVITICGNCIIGREGNVETEYFAQDMEISRNHCSITLEDGGYKVKHLSKTNPTKIGNIELSPYISKTINDGDVLTIARKKFKISFCPGSAGNNERSLYAN